MIKRIHYKKIPTWREVNILKTQVQLTRIRHAKIDFEQLISKLERDMEMAETYSWQNWDAEHKQRLLNHYNDEYAKLMGW